jgi:Protein of unknown function (DUF2934)
MSLLYQVKPFLELGVCKEYCMPRKSTGSSTTRIRKTAVTQESAAVQPTPLQVVPELKETKVTPREVRKNGATNGAAVMNAANLDDEIRHRAYELYLERNGQAGDPNADWFVAEREVLARHAAAGHSA